MLLWYTWLYIDITFHLIRQQSPGNSSTLGGITGGWEGITALDGNFRYVVRVLWHDSFFSFLFYKFFYKFFINLFIKNTYNTRTIKNTSLRCEKCLKGEIIVRIGYDMNYLSIEPIVSIWVWITHMGTIGLQSRKICLPVRMWGHLKDLVVSISPRW